MGLHSFLAYILANPEMMLCRQVEDFSQKIASDFAEACSTDEQSEDGFGTAYNYGRDHVTRLTHEIIRLQWRVVYHERKSLNRSKILPVI